MKLFEQIITLLTPFSCLKCRTSGRLLCANCQATLPLPKGVCFDCHIKITTPNSIGCLACLKRIGVTQALAVTDYAGLGRTIVGQLKFRGNREASRVMAGLMVGRLTTLDGIIVSMPSTAQHIRQRGFDQAQLIAKEIARLSGLKYVQGLARQGRHHQLGSDRDTRHDQLVASLRVINAAQIKNRPVLLVDDVLTTGSSIRAATRVLRQAGAQRVDILTFAQSVAVIRLQNGL